MTKFDGDGPVNAPPEFSRRHKSMSSVDRESLGPKGKAGIPEDASLDASHALMREAVAVQVTLIHEQATKGGLTTSSIEQLAAMANIWRTLKAQEPAPSLEDLTEDELRAQLDAVKRRSK